MDKSKFVVKECISTTKKGITVEDCLGGKGLGERVRMVVDSDGIKIFTIESRGCTITKDGELNCSMKTEISIYYPRTLDQKLYREIAKAYTMFTPPETRSSKMRFYKTT